MIIFNADDYGLTPIDTSRILDVIDFGIIKSTTIMATHIAGDDVFKLKGKQCSTGLHINLVEGKALSGVSTLTDSTGEFLSKKTTFQKDFIKANR